MIFRVLFALALAHTHTQYDSLFVFLIIIISYYYKSFFSLQFHNLIEGHAYSLILFIFFQLNNEYYSQIITFLIVIVSKVCTVLLFPII